MPGPPAHRLKIASQDAQPPGTSKAVDSSDSKEWSAQDWRHDAPWQGGWSCTSQHEQLGRHYESRQTHPPRAGHAERQAPAPSDLPQQFVSLSRALASVLRHQATKLGIELRKDGYARVADVLASLPLQRALETAGLPESAAETTLHEVVKKSINTEHKPRFEFWPVTDTGEERWIRATGKSTKLPAQVNVHMAAPEHGGEGAEPAKQSAEPPSWEPWAEVDSAAHSHVTIGLPAAMRPIAGSYVDEWKPDNVIVVSNEVSTSVTISCPALDWAPSAAAIDGDRIRWDAMAGRIRCDSSAALTIEWDNGGKWLRRQEGT